MSDLTRPAGRPRRWFHVVPAVVCFGVLGLLAVPLGPAPHSSATIEQYVAELTSSGVPGVAVVVTERDAVLHRVSGGDVDVATPVPVASLTKSFTAAAVLKLSEEGRLSLDDPVVKHLPAFTLADGGGKGISIRQILNQSSGLTDRTLGFDQYSVHPRTAAEAIRLLVKSRPAYPPGTDWDYCNVNYWIAQALVEAVSGQPLSDFLRVEFFGPLEMTSTTFADFTGGRADAAIAHAAVFGRWVSIAIPRTFTGGAGGVWTTAEDLARWARFQQAQGPGVGTVLSAASLEEMHRRQSPLPQYKVGYALGWWTGEPAGGGISRTSHSGAGAGYSSYMGLFPGDITISVFVSSNSPRADHIAQDILDIRAGHCRAPERPSQGWVDSLICGLAALIIYGCVAGIRHRICGLLAWRQHAVALLAMATTALILLVPSILGRVTARQSPWKVIFTQMPVMTVALASVALACGGLVVVHGGALLRHCLRRSGCPAR